jgi:hypothetical protein
MAGEAVLSLMNCSSALLARNTHSRSSPVELPSSSGRVWQIQQAACNSRRRVDPFFHKWDK